MKGTQGRGPVEGRRFVLPTRFRGLKAQIVLWTALPLTLVLIAVAFTGVYSHERAMRILVEGRDQALAAVSAGQVRDLLRERVAALQSLAAEQPFRRGNPGQQRARLADAGNLGGLFVSGLVVTDEAGNLLAMGAGAAAWLAGAGQAIDLVRAVMAHQEAVLGPVLAAPSGEDLFLLGVPAYDDNGKTHGCLVGAIAPSGLGLDLLLGQAQVGEQAVVYLVDGSGRVLAHSPSERARNSLAGHTGMAVVLQDPLPGVTLCHSPDGEQMTLAYAPVSYAGGDWRVIVEQPWHEVIGPVLRYSQFVPLVAALAAVVSLLSLYYGVRSIAQPLRSLGQRAERVAWGDFDATNQPVGGVEEIEDLRRTLDQMAKRIQNYQRGMHDYIAAITHGQEEERKRLARELHDDTAQALIALGQQVEMAQKLLATDPGRAAERLARAQAMLADSLEGVRRFSRDLRPIYLEDLGFVPALEMLVQEADRQGTVAVHFATAGTLRRLSPDLELAAYRIIQEALNNVLKHAQAARAWVEVRFEEEQVILSVRDDGNGFEPPDLPDALARRGHFGLMGIQERALLYGGQLAIYSAPSAGTEIVVNLPTSRPHRSV